MYRLRVLVNDKPIPIYRDYKTGTDWVEARSGVRYVIEVKNESYNRILAVVSVDGLNVINGKHEDSSVASGYILHSYNNIKIPGWKISQDNVREFYFTRPEESYSHKLGADESNTGVIAAAIYKEKVITYTTTNVYKSEPWVFPRNPYWPFSTTITCFSGSGRMSASSEPINLSSNVQQMNFVDSQPEKLATGSGGVKDFRTHKMNFGERELETILTLYYDTYDNLVRKGIIGYSNQGLPKPFPNGSGYCPDL